MSGEAPVFDSVADLEARIEEISEALSDASVQRNPKELKQLAKELKELRSAFSADVSTAQVWLNPEVVATPGGADSVSESQPGGQLLPQHGMIADRTLPLLTWASQLERINRYYWMTSNAKYRGPRIVAEGDSWFDLPLPWFGNDVVDWLGRQYAVYPLSAAGDTIARMVNASTLSDTVDRIRSERADLFLFSAGGNDLLGGDNFASYLADFVDDASDRYFIDELDDLLKFIDGAYRMVLSRLRTEFQASGLKVVSHVYDYPIPRPNRPIAWTRWMAPALESRGYSYPAWNKVPAQLIDRFAAILARLETEFSGFFIVVKTLGAVGLEMNSWFDEIHPKNAGFGRVSERFKSSIDTLWVGR